MSATKRTLSITLPKVCRNVLKIFSYFSLSVKAPNGSLEVPEPIRDDELG